VTPEQLEQLRQLLIAQQEGLLANQESAKDATRPVMLDQSSVGRLSRMDAMQGQAMAVATQRRRSMQLQRIQSALARIERGDYGLCAVCEEEIALRRLLSDPAVPLCIDCAAKQERNQPG